MTAGKYRLLPFLCTALAVLLLAASPCQALSAAGYAARPAGQPALVMNGVVRDLLFDIRQGDSGYLVSAPDIAGLTGCSFNFYPAESSIIFKKGSEVLQLVLDQGLVFKNGREHFLGLRPRAADGVIYVPLQFTADFLGFKTDYNRETDTFNLTRLEKKASEATVTSDSVSGLLPAGSELFMAKDSQGGTLAADLDGDGAVEYAARYSLAGGGGGAVIYRERDGLFELVWKKDGESVPSRIDITDLNGGSPELLVCWNMGALGGFLLEVFTWEAGGFNSLFSGTCSRYEYADFNNDGAAELALWQHDTANAYRVTLYSAAGSGMTPLENCSAYYRRVVDHYNSSGPVSDMRPVRYYLAEAHYRSLNYRQAVLEADKGLEDASLYPLDRDFLILKGMALARMERTPEARRLLFAALSGKSAPVNPEARFIYALCWYRLGDMEEALRQLVRTVNEGNESPVDMEARQLIRTIREAMELKLQ